MTEPANSRLPVNHGTAEDRLRITEIFYSLQGEASRQGEPCAFVRLMGCNLRCVWCDTEYSFTGGTTMTLDQIMEQVRGYGVSLVEITGGEPLLQKATPKLATRLLEEGYTVLCETSGERDIDLLPEGVSRIMDLKAPGSDEVEANRWDNIAKLRHGDELKIVIKDRVDFEWACQTVAEHGLWERFPIFFSPVHGELSANDLAQWILEAKIPARLNLQLHKLLWGEERGR